MKHLLLSALALITLSAHAHAQVAGEWKTILSTEQELKDYPPGQASLEDGLLHVRAGNGIWIPQPYPDGAIRALFHFREKTSWPQLRIRRTADVKPQDSEYYEIILNIKMGETSINDVFLNFTSKGKIKRLAVVPLPKPFVLGDYLDLELSAVGEHLQVRVNGKVAYETDDKSIATGGLWGVASDQAWFSKIQVRSFPPKSNDPRLVQLEESYAAAIDREAPLPPHLEALQALDDKYAAALDRALDAATKAGNLDAALALRTEKKRVQDATPLPADDQAANETLKPLRATYRSALSQLTTQHDQRLQTLREKFLQALDAYQAELTRAKNLDAALEVRKRRELEAASGKAP
jgi:hypothetical protein